MDYVCALQEEITRLAEQNAREAAEAMKHAAADVAPVVPVQAAPPSPVASRRPREERRYTIVEKPEELKQPQRRYPVAPYASILFVLFVVHFLEAEADLLF